MAELLSGAKLTRAEGVDGGLRLLRDVGVIRFCLFTVVGGGGGAFTFLLPAPG